jgi:glycosyltransferase involved in cell wall biosynthesis
LIEHQLSGLLFEVGDASALAMALERLANDATLRARLGAGARERAQAQFSIPAMVHVYETHYREAAKSLGVSR